MFHSKIMRRFVRHAQGAAIAVILLSSPLFASDLVFNDPRVLPPTEFDYGKLSVEWWQWALKQPVTNNPRTTSPLLDTTGVAAHNGQPNPKVVFFLCGLISFNSGLVASAERTIVIPAYTHLFFPILNVEEDNVGVVPPLSIASLRSLANFSVTQTTSLDVSIDGVPVERLDEYRVISPVFGYTLPPNNAKVGSVNLAYALTNGAINVSGFEQPVVSDGYYLLLRPLTPGHHTVKFGGTTKTLDANNQPATFHLDITYHITVAF